MADGPKPGGFIWYELMTPDADDATRFYGAVVGWKIEGGAGAGPVDYRHIIRDDGGDAGGMLNLSADMVAHGARPAWVPYLHVADLDATIAAVAAEGGRVLMPATALPVGRFAMVADPQGVPIYVMTPVPPPGKEDVRSDVFSNDAVQRVTWNELASPDLDASKAIYSRHFGFEFNDVMPMGPMGDYCFIDHDGVRVGAMMQAQDAAAAAQWRVYFRVPSVTVGKAAVEAAGGTVLDGPHEVPGGDFIIIARDPQGAEFGLVGANTDAGEA